MPGSQPVQSITRALDVVESLADVQEGMTAIELSGKLGVSRPTIHGILKTLESKLYVEQLVPGRFCLGRRVEEIAQVSRLPEWHLQIPALLKEGSRLHKGTNWIFTEPDGYRMMTRYDCGSKKGRRGSVLHPYHTASGLLLQAFAPPAVMQELKKRYPFKSYGEDFWETPARLKQFLADVRETRICAPPVGTQYGLRIAVPIFDDGGVLLGGMGVFKPRPFALALAARLMETLEELASRLVIEPRFTDEG